MHLCIFIDILSSIIHVHEVNDGERTQPFITDDHFSGGSRWRGVLWMVTLFIQALRAPMCLLWASTIHMFNQM
jgi:hypothetical protein